MGLAEVQAVMREQGPGRHARVFAASDSRKDGRASRLNAPNVLALLLLVDAPIMGKGRNLSKSYSFLPPRDMLRGHGFAMLRLVHAIAKHPQMSSKHLEIKKKRLPAFELEEHKCWMSERAE
ncbi:hypothetical protein CBOM_03625 [Ceraceosorus bombacis]|uniref:Uncharacterized protein n=1 Tax=Ceraceosorus bombacis TaxID=401625 RepID=A0A0P1BGJ6_9BASI|nr:hypothetical protein CBOM_03625 [Ceraceosorus bombacis]